MCHNCLPHHISVNCYRVTVACQKLIYLAIISFFFFLFWSKGKRKPEKNVWVHTGKRKSCWKASVLKVKWDREWKQEIFFFFRFSYCKSTFSVPLQIVILAFPEQILKIFHFCMGYKAYFSTLWL